MFFCLYSSVLQSSSLSLQNQPASAASLQVPGHLLQPSQSYVPAVPSTAPVQPSYVPASQTVLQTYSSLPSSAQQQATILQPVQPPAAQSTSTVPQMANIQSCPITGQPGQPIIQANAAVLKSFTPGMQQLASTNILPPLQQVEPSQTLPSLQQATQNLLPDQQSTVQHLTSVQNLPASQCSVQPVSAFIAVQHVPTVQRGASSLQHGQEDPLLIAQVTAQKVFHATGIIAAGKADFQESAFLSAPSQTGHRVDVPAHQVSFKV